MIKTLPNKSWDNGHFEQNRLVKLQRAHQHHAHTPGLAVSRAGLMWGNLF